MYKNSLFQVKTVFQDVSAETLYDVLMDSQYRTRWDKYMKENYEIGHINPNNNLGYFASNNHISTIKSQWSIDIIKRKLYDVNL